MPLRDPKEICASEMRPYRPAGLLLFDGDCGLCTALAGWARQRDPGFRFSIVPYQSLSEEELSRLGLTRHRCSQSLQLVTDEGGVHGGIGAVNRFLWNRTGWRPVVAVLYLFPPALFLEWIGYRLVSRYRGWISRRLGLEGCALVMEDVGQ